MTALFYYFRLFLCGLCMGAADLIPGISGGTVAFILGIYEPFIESIKSFNTKAFFYLFTFKLKKFSGTVSWKVLCSIVLGSFFSMATLAHFVTYILGHEVYRVWLYASFMGLVVASAIFCARQIPKWSWKEVIWLLIGAFIAYKLSGTALLTSHQEASYTVSFGGIDPWIVLCGAIAICAMLLPGISGSYLLTILGVYPAILAALAEFASGIKHWHFASEAFFLLLSLALGIIIGSLFFSRVISWLLKCYSNLTIATLTGFMVGAIQTVWPFWSYQYFLDPLKLEKGLQLQVLHPILPDPTSSLCWIALIFALGGFGMVFLLEYLSKLKLEA